MQLTERFGVDGQALTGTLQVILGALPAILLPEPLQRLLQMRPQLPVLRVLL